MPIFFILLIGIKKKHIQHEMKERMENEVLHVVAVKTNEIIWEKKGKEIVIGDRMFDVKSYTIKGNVTIFLGLYDEEEASLKSLVNSEMSKQSKKNNTIISEIFQLLQSFYCNNGIVEQPAVMQKATYSITPTAQLTNPTLPSTYSPPDC